MNRFISYASTNNSTQQKLRNESSSNMYVSGDEKKSDSPCDDITSKRHPGKISNISIVSLDAESHIISHQQTNPQQASSGDERESEVDDDDLSGPDLKQGLSHGKEYAIVGPNAWAVLSSRFGFDYNLERPIKILPNGKAAVEVYLKPGSAGSTLKLVILPLGGQWDLPKDIRYKEDISNESSPMNDLVSTLNINYFGLLFS